MIYLSEFKLSDGKEWLDYKNIYTQYIEELYSESDDFKETIEFINNEQHHTDILRLTNRLQNRFHICRIYNDDIYIGFCDYICYTDENGKCLIGNFFLFPEFRNSGYGKQAFNLIEKALIESGGRYIDITPSPRAISFYERKGFLKTNDISLENGETVFRKIIN